MATARGTTDLTEVSPAQGDGDVTNVAPESSSVPPPAASVSSAPPSPAYVTCGHDVLFGDDGAANCCDVCGKLVTEDDGEGPALPGRALYVWARGDELRRDEPPLCPSCAAALGLSALGRWEIEEEEG